jgi:hypothetical protein
MDEQISQLRSLRNRIAAYSQTLAERELTGRLLRLELETEKRAAGSTKTDAEKDAKADPRYLDHERRSIQISFDRDVALAEAEALRFHLELVVAERMASVA